MVFKIALCLQLILKLEKVQMAFFIFFVSLISAYLFILLNVGLPKEDIFLTTFYGLYQFIHCLDVIIEPLLYISVVHIAFQLMYIHITIQRHSIFRVPTAGFNPPKQREDCY